MEAILAVAGILLVNFQGSTNRPDTSFVAETSFGSFEQATRITIGPQGWIYVIDSKKNAVLIFKTVRDQPSLLGGFGWSSVTFDNPTGVATDGLNVFVSDYGNHRIERFDRYSHLLSSLYTRDTSIAGVQFGYPTGIALTQQGNLIILDSENLKVVEFSADSRFERSYADLNSSGGKLQYPIKVCVQGDEFVYVLEKRRILQFDFFGNYIRSFANDLRGEIIGGQTIPSGIAAVSGDTVYSFNDGGALISRISLATLIGETPIHGVRDIAFYNNRLFVLTETRCHVFIIEPVHN
jgi:hypothetical protein